MSANFIRRISELYDEKFNAHLGELVKSQTPCGIFFGFNMNPSNVTAAVQMFQNNNLNISCVIVLSDVQADALKSSVKIPVITLKHFPRFGKKKTPVKPQVIFIPDAAKDPAFTPYFARFGCECVSMIYAGLQNDYFRIMIKHLPELYSVYEMFGSDESKKVFCAAIKGRLTGKIGDYRFAPEAQYFLEGFTPSAGDIAIDGGAYDGVTALAFAKCGAKVYSFEMNATNYQNCAARLNASGGGYDIIFENLGLSNRESEETYSGDGAGSRKNPSGNLRGKFIDLDTYVARKNLPRVDYIKLDIEGAELDMLHGAAKTITRCKPKMAVSAYHKWDDLWTLATYIKSLRPDYEFEFRHYKINSVGYTLNDDELKVLEYFKLDYLVPTYCEMVLYCR